MWNDGERELHFFVDNRSSAWRVAKIFLNLRFERRRIGAITHVAGVECPHRLKTQNQGLFVRARAVFYAPRHDDTLARPQRYHPISEFDAEPAAPNHEKLVYTFVMVPGKFALHFH